MEHLDERSMSLLLIRSLVLLTFGLWADVTRSAPAQSLTVSYQLP